MSDIFDHMNDAFDRHEADQGDEDHLYPAELMRGPARQREQAAIAAGTEIRSGQPRGGCRHRKPYAKQPVGPGPCPKCGAETRFRPGGPTYSPFYGCSTYPACKGARTATPEEIATFEDNQSFWTSHGLDAPTERGDREDRDNAPAKGRYPYGIKHHADGQKGTP